MGVASLTHLIVNMAKFLAFTYFHPSAIITLSITLSMDLKTKVGWRFRLMGLEILAV